ncbi:hypothetical protein ACLKA6_017523 [Drosophila palustris]
MGVQWISYRRKSELQGILKESGWTRKAPSRMKAACQLASQPIAEGLGQRLAELNDVYPTRPQIRPRVRHPSRQSSHSPSGHNQCYNYLPPSPPHST